jgi:hypothetical protein
VARKLIGLSGFAGSGKDTLANILVNDYNFTKVSFADRLKDTVSTIFGWDRSWLEGDTPETRIWREQTDTYWSKELGYDITPRLMMQRVGTDSLRKGFSDRIWILIVKQVIEQYPDKNIVVPDVRFYNERQLIRDFQGQSWRIKKGPDPDWTSKAISDNRYDTDWMITERPHIHESEWRWLDHDANFDRVITNNSTTEALQDTIHKIMG